jgi:DNA-binding CsgD family transcriptional regulator|tara:strand:+ start:445 stop:759 length:315 start_codon:yes stop_codon:yes gene_type:complete
MARPKKYDIKEEEVLKLAGYGCTQREIADFYGCDESLISKNYSSIIAKGKADLKKKLRKAQLKLALEGNATMLVWLGKQMLGQSDKQEVTTTELPKGFDTHHIE